MLNLAPCFLAAATLVASATLTFAQNAAPAPARPAATAVAPAAPVAPAAVAAPAAAPSFPAEGLDALRPHIGEMVNVTGTPTATGHSKTGTVAYLNFAGAHKAVAVVAFLGGGKGVGADASVQKVTSEDDLKTFVGKPVVVHGKLADYKGDLQIVLDSLDQIKLAQ